MSIHVLHLDGTCYLRAEDVVANLHRHADIAETVSADGGGAGDDGDRGGPDARARRPARPDPDPTRHSKEHIMTSYYFAARYSRNPELRAYRDELLAKVPGAVVTSRWIDQHGGELEASYTPEALAADPTGCWEHGRADLEDLANAEVIVSFTGAGGGGKGGRHVEHAIAIAYVDNGPWLTPNAASFRLVVVGPREHIFHCHPATEVYRTWDDFLNAEVAS